MRNPKQDGSRLFDCVPQHGPCPNNCNQCYYNICFYAGHEPWVPEPRDVAGGIVRMNSGHDSNLEKDLVLETAKMYEDVFFNTSMERLSFPGPVVLTANPSEECERLSHQPPPTSKCRSLMFVRFRTSATNLDWVLKQADKWTDQRVPVVLTLMQYMNKDDVPKGFEDFYEQKISIINEWWRPTKKLWVRIQSRPEFHYNRLIQTCGSSESKMCCDCGLCECYYRITKKRLAEKRYYK